MRPLPRVRKEPPTIREAIEAAVGLSSDPDAQVEIAAGLMGVPQEEVRPLVTRRAPMTMMGKRVVVVERRSLRRGA